MSEELYFVKFNKEVARAELPELINNVNDPFPYHTYLLENQSNYEERLELEIITIKIKENIELLTVDELWTLVNWFSDRSDFLADKRGENYVYHSPIGQMSHYGLDLFFEIPSKTPVRKFHSLLNDFMALTNQDIDYRNDVDQLKMFCKYAICYCGEMMLFLNTHYYERAKNDPQNLKILEYISEINLASDGYYHQLALAEIEKSREYNLETAKLMLELSEFTRTQNHNSSYSIPLALSENSRRESAIIEDAFMFYRIVELRDLIKDYHGKVIRLHSY